jgi:hypothetical protein
MNEDDGKLIVFTNTTGAISVTVNQNNNFVIGTQINLALGFIPASTANYVQLVEGLNVNLGSPNGLFLRDKYALCTIVKIANNPDVVSSNYALLSAAWFWSKNGLNKLADGGATDQTVTSITKRVNGGTIGLVDRIKHFKEYYHLLA